MGAFHILPLELQHSLFTVSIKDATKTRAATYKSLFEQQETKRRREKLARENKIVAAKEEYIIALYYHETFSFDACWKIANQVDREIESLCNVSAKLGALKEKIHIHGLGFGLCGLHTAWSYKVTVKMPKSPAVYFKIITKEETSRPIPNKPPTHLPSQNHVSTLGTLSNHVIVMYRSCSENDH